MMRLFVRRMDNGLSRSVGFQLFLEFPKNIKTKIRKYVEIVEALQGTRTRGNELLLRESHGLFPETPLTFCSQVFARFIF